MDWHGIKYSFEMSSFNDLWKPFKDVKEISAIQSVIDNKVNDVGRLVLPFGLGAAATLGMMTFLAWVSGLIRMEKEADTSKNKKEDATSET